MTRSEVERTQRAASRSVRVQPTGDPELLPPTNQAAEERPGSHRRRCAMRIGLRSLVIGGFAGVTWLLTAGAAQAADAEMPGADAAGDLSVVTLFDGFATGAVEGVDDGECSAVMPVTEARGTGSPAKPSTVGGLLAPVDWATAVVLPCTTAAEGAPLADLAPVESPTAAVTTTAATDASAGGVRRGAGEADTGALLGSVTGLVAPRGQTDASASPIGVLAPLTRVVSPVVAPLDVVLRPATDLPPSVTAPVSGMLQPIVRAVAGTVTEPAGAQAQTPAPRPIPAGVAVPGATVGPAVASPTGRAAESRESSSTISVRRTIGTELRGTGTADPRPGTPLPDRTPPAPLRAHLGTGPGTPASGWGVPSEGGLCAAVSSSVVGSMVAFRRLPVTTDVAVLRHDAEAPTVSPD